MIFEKPPETDYVSLKELRCGDTFLHPETQENYMCCQYRNDGVSPYYLNLEQGIFEDFNNLKVKVKRTVIRAKVEIV